MRILTWNINGIRACKQPLKNELSDLSSDIICLQETKITRDLLDEETAIQDGYNSFFSFSKKRSGYSGVATYCKTHTTPVHVEEGLSGILHDSRKADELIGHYGDLSEFTDEELISLESEGRAILTEHQYRDISGKMTELVIINVYCPRADPDREGRLDYKLNFYKLLQIRAEALLQAKKHVIILGDFNVSHKPIDHCDPDDDDEKFYARPSRRWLGQLLEDVPSDQTRKKQSSRSSQGKKKFIDTFRYFHPAQENAFTCWSTATGARQTNYGTRIDYIVSNTKLCKEDFKDCEILQDFEGSDHCPVRASLKGAAVACNNIPASCTKFMPEFLGGKQQKLSSFFTKGVSKDKNAVGDNITGKASGTEQKAGGTINGNVSNTTKRPLEAYAMEQSSKKTKYGKKTYQSKAKTTSITNFFRKVPAVPQPATEEVTDKSREVERGPQSDIASDISSPENLHQSDNTNVSRQDSAKKISPMSVLNKEAGEKETKTKKRMVSSWKDILKGPPPAPICKGHQEPCVLRTVKKSGPNLGKQFFVCCRPEGHKNNPDARCNHFEWVGPVLKKLKEVKTSVEPVT